MSWAKSEVGKLTFFWFPSSSLGTRFSEVPLRGLAVWPPLAASVKQSFTEMRSQAWSLGTS